MGEDRKDTMMYGSARCRSSHPHATVCWFRVVLSEAADVVGVEDAALELRLFRRLILRSCRIGVREDDVELREVEGASALLLLLLLW
jgi:hypothetical protein